MDNPHGGSDPTHISDWLQRHGFVFPVETIARSVMITNTPQCIRVTPLSWACYTGQLVTVKELACTFGAAFCGDKYSDMASPFLMAAFSGHLHVCRWLIQMGAFCDLLPVITMSPLYIACERGHTTLCKQLVAWGANVNCRNAEGRTPLWAACYFGTWIRVSFS